MPRPKNPTKEPFRRMQVVSPVPSKRRYGRAKWAKRPFDIYVTDLETGDETFVMTLSARDGRQANVIARKLLYSSPVLRKITYAAFTAVEVEPNERSKKPK